MKVISVCLMAVLLLLVLGLLQEISARATITESRGDSGRGSNGQQQLLLTDSDILSSSTNSDIRSEKAMANTRPVYPPSILGSNIVFGSDNKPVNDNHLVNKDIDVRAINVDDEEDDEDEIEDLDEEEEDEEDQDYEWSEEDLDMIKQKILDGLGLTTVPVRTKANITQEEYDQAYSEYIRLVQEEEARNAEAFLKYYDEEDEEGERELLKELEEHEEAEDNNNSALTSDYRFFSTGVSRHTKKQRGRGRRSTRTDGQIVHFHVAVPVRRVYAHNIDVKKATCRLWKTGGPEPQDSLQDTIKVDIYRMDENGRRRKRRKQDPVLIKSLNISVTGDEWLSIDVTSAVKEWIKSPRGDAGVLVQCPECVTAGVKIHTGLNSSNTTYVPVLDVQTEVPAGRRVKRSKELTRATKAKWRRRGDCRNNKRSGNRKSRCCRRSMKVRFKDLPRFDFVESPKEFDAYYCSGRCPARFNPANEHALLQSLMKIQQPHGQDIPRPCCAPTALQGLHILHVNDHGKLTTTYWSDVIVTECGCA